SGLEALRPGRPSRPPDCPPREPWEALARLTAPPLMLSVPGLPDQTLPKARFLDWRYGEPAHASTRAAPPTRRPAPVPSRTRRGAARRGLVGQAANVARDARRPDVGPTRARAAVNAGLGYLSWLVLTPLVLVIYFAVLLATPKDWVWEHPLTKAGQQPLALSE